MSNDTIIDFINECNKCMAEGMKWFNESLNDYEMKTDEQVPKHNLESFRLNQVSCRRQPLLYHRKGSRKLLFMCVC